MVQETLHRIAARPPLSQPDPLAVTITLGLNDAVFLFYRYLGGKYHFGGFLGHWYAVVLVCVVFLVSRFLRRLRGRFPHDKTKDRESCVCWLEPPPLLGAAPGEAL